MRSVHGSAVESVKDSASSRGEYSEYGQGGGWEVGKVLVSIGSEASSVESPAT